MVEDKDRDLGTVVSYLVGRPVRTVEIIDAIGVSRSGYYLSREAGRLVTADHLLKIADAFRLNPVDLLVRFGLLNPNSAIEYVANLEALASTEEAKATRARRLRRRPDAPPL